MRCIVSLLLAIASMPIIYASVMEFPRPAYTFEQNVGQAHEAVKFLARGDGYGLFLTEREAVLTLSSGARTQHTVRMALDGSRRPQTIEGISPTSQATSYFLGDDPKAWRTKVSHFGGVLYRGIYAGVDLVYHSNADRLEYDFAVAAGASADVIKLRFEGMSRIRLTSSGALELCLGARKLIHQPPFAYQDVGGGRRPVQVSYRLLGGNRVGFAVGPHDSDRPLIIDPVVIYSTFLGGDRTDTVHSVAVDSQGNTYVTGETSSTNFPVKGSGISKIQGGVTSAFVTKLNAAGSAIVYSAYLGGSSNTRGYAIAVDKDGNAFLGGVTGARDFPLVNPVQNKQPGLNIGYVAKLNAQGSALLFSTYLGGERNDEVRDLGLDKNGNIHVVGRATSAQFPILNAFQSTFGGSSDAFAAVYNAPNYRLAYSTFLGGASAEEANALALDSAGNTYLTGLAQGPGLATAGAYQSKIVSPNDIFVAKLSATGKQLLWLTYYGGRGDDKAYAIALDASGNVIVGGSSNSDNLPMTSTALQSKMRGDNDAFLAKFGTTGHDLLYASYFGSTSTRTGIAETINQIAIDPWGRVNISGVTNGADLPTVRPLQAFGGGKSDGFAARLNSALTGLEFSTPIGGTLDDTVFGMTLDSTGGVHLGGDTLSTNFPLKKAISTTFAGAREGFVSYICDPRLLPSLKSLEFSYEIGKAVPAEQKTQISTCNPIPFQAQAEGTFLAVTPKTATTNASLAVSVQTSGLKAGTYSGQVRITAADAANSPLLIPVVLKITPAPVPPK